MFGCNTQPRIHSLDGTHLTVIHKQKVNPPSASARIIHDGSSRNRAVATRDRRAEPRGGVMPRLGVPKRGCPLRGDSTRGLAPL
jgi:hypothetical protein